MDSGEPAGQEVARDQADTLDREIDAVLRRSDANTVRSAEVLKDSTGLLEFQRQWLLDADGSIVKARRVTDALYIDLVALEDDASEFPPGA